MKILLTTPFRHDPVLGGPAQTVVTTAARLSETGLEVGLVTGHNMFLPIPKPAKAALAFPKAQVVHHFGIWLPLSHAVSSLSRMVQKPVVLAPIGMLEPWALAQKSRKKRFALQTYQLRDLRSAAVIHATGPGEVSSVQALGVRRPIALIPHGMDVPDATRKNADERGERRIALFLSRIHPKKGLINLVEAWASLRPEGWQVLIAGPDELGHRAEVEAEVCRHGLTADFSFLGPVSWEEKDRLLRTADLFVLPTHSENFGLVIPEALAQGTPVITTVGAPWSEVRETNSGWWVEVGTEPLIAALREALALSSSELAAMGANGRQLVKSRYSWAAIAEKHVQLYKWMVAGGPKPAFIID